MERVHVDYLDDIAMVNVSSIWVDDKTQCLTSLDISDYDFIDVFKDSFMHVIIKLEKQLNHIIYVCGCYG